MYHRTGGFTEHEREVYKSLVYSLIHEGRVIDSTFLDDQPNLRPTFAAIGFDCLLNINEKICPIFVLQFYISVRLIRKLNGNIAISFIINNFEIALTLEEFARILKIPCQGHEGKMPRLPTPNPSNSESSDSPSPIPHQGMENDPVNNFTLDPIPYMNQLPPIKGGESSEFKQTKGMFKCLFHFLSKKK
ncbi:hypothetical protein Tco_0629799 [Tanacetum coccineum]|uniref:Uncharacterized protein n=1 Tax=Tanacetum coccineum TaxID=301880 RepID=A0ABQ4WUA6_9ASTR